MYAGNKRPRSEADAYIGDGDGASKLARFRAWRKYQSAEDAKDSSVDPKPVYATASSGETAPSKLSRLKKLAEWRKKKQDSGGATEAQKEAASTKEAPPPKKRKVLKFKGFKSRQSRHVRKRSGLAGLTQDEAAKKLSPNLSSLSGLASASTGSVGTSGSPKQAAGSAPADLDSYLASIGVPAAASGSRPMEEGEDSGTLAEGGGTISASIESDYTTRHGQQIAAASGQAITAEDLADQLHDETETDLEAGAAREEEKGLAGSEGAEAQHRGIEDDDAYHGAFLKLAAAPAAPSLPPGTTPVTAAAGSSSSSSSSASASAASTAPSITTRSSSSSSSSAPGGQPEGKPGLPSDHQASSGHSAGAASGAGAGGMQTGEDLLDSLFVGNEWTGATAASGASSGTAVLKAFQDKQARRLHIVAGGAASATPVHKNLYKPATTIARKAQHIMQNERAEMGLRVRGRAVPAPIDSWHQCGVSSALLRALQSSGYEQPFAIQRQAVPCIMSGRDVIGVAKTGSGKTLAFVVPALRHALAQPKLQIGDGPLVVILAPMRELAMQLFEETRKLGLAAGLHVVPVYGGAPIAEQIAACKSQPHVVVGTPGRMIYLMALNGGKVLRLNRASMLVLDEADRMFDMGFGPQVEQIVGLMRPDKQAVLFSATFPEHIVKLAREMLVDPVEVVVGGGKSVASDAVRQQVEVRSPKTKFARLLQLLGDFVSRGQVLVFVDTKEACDDLFTSLMGAGYEPLTLHGGKDQQDRDETLDEFRKGECELLVATSVAGRGLDVPGICLVVNYDCPTHLEDYVHRVGRTGRAGRKGDAVTFVQPDQAELAPDLVRALTDANQVVADALQALADDHKDKVKRGEAKKRRSGFTNRGTKVDGTELTEAGIGQQIERLRMQSQQGQLDEDTFLRLEAELEARLAEVRDGKSKKQQEKEAAKAKAAAAAAAGPLPTASELAMLRAKATAAQSAIAQGRGSTEGAREAIAKYAAAEEALALASVDEGAMADARARAYEAMAAVGAGGTKAKFSQELGINEYPKAARAKALRQETIQNIAEWFGCGVINTGIYVPLGRKPPAGERPLTLVIEGESEINVRRARAELRRLLDEATEAVDAERFSLESALAGGNGMAGSGSAGGALAELGQGYGT